MSRFCTILLLAVALSCLSLCANAAPLPADQIFPDAAKGFFAIQNFKEFEKQWEKTQFGQLMNDPLMDNFKKEIHKQLTERGEKIFGLPLESIFTLPSGEVAVGMISLPDQAPGYVLTMDVAGQRSKTDQYLADLTQKLVTAGVKKSTETYKEQQITVLVFPSSAAPQSEPAAHNVYYMFLQDVLIASDRLYLLQLIADRIAGQNTMKSLAETEGYQVVMKRCISDIPGGLSPGIRWYVDPLGYGEAILPLLQSQSSAVQNRKEKPSVLSILKQQGFDALHGIGGVISVKTEAQEAVYRTFIYTKKPYRQAMRMFNFPDQTNFAPPAWMPDDLARCTMLCVDPQAIFDNVGVLFDALVMPGEEGVWQAILDGLEKDIHGPQINIRTELIDHLGNRVLGMSRYEKPITVKSESVVVAVELKAGHEQAMLAGIEKLFGTDPEMMGTEHKSYKIWHRKPTEDIIAPEDFDIPNFFGNSQPNAAKAPQPAKETEPMFPEGGMVVAKGCLFVSTNIEYLEVILDRLDAPAESSIGNAPEYKAVNQIFAGLGMTDKPHFVQFFARSYETLRPTYEMIRQDQMAQSQAVLAKALNELLSPKNESGIRRQIIDGSTLPEFDKVQHYFGTVGIYGASEENGYFIKGFALER